MKHLSLGLCIFSMMFLSCTDANDFIKKGQHDYDYDKNIDFSTRDKYNINVKALSFEGKGMEGIPIEIYLENPYSENGVRGEVKPIYIGYTLSDGTINMNLDIPNGTISIFIFSPFAGCPCKEVKLSDLSNQITLDMNIITESSRTSRSDMEEIRECRNINSNEAKDINLFQFYNEKEINEWGIPLPNSTLVSNKSYEKGLYTLINKTYPENVENHNDKIYWKKNTDLVIESESGTEIWVSFAGDGGFADKNVHNSLAYYTYPDGDDISNYSDAQIKALHKTILFPSLQDNGYSSDQILPLGRRVKLMYYNENTKKYSTVFPKGLRLGFMFIQKGFNKTLKSDFSQKGYGNHINDLTHLRFTTAEFNKACGVKGTKGENDPFFGDKISRGISRGLIYNGVKFNVVGMDYTYGTNQNGNDKDLNDALIIVESSPYIRPNDVVPPPEPKPNVKYYMNYGTLAFEDNWPQKGDYDFNDFVVDYEYGFGKSDNYQWDDVKRQYIYTLGNLISEISLKFKPRAVGAFKNSGFAIEVPISEENIDKAKLHLPQGVVLESGHKNAVFVIYENTRKPYGSTAGYINTEKSIPYLKAESVNIIVPLIKGVDDKSLKVTDYNPFLFLQNWNKEIHLVDKRPVKENTYAYFNTEDDKSDISKNIYYRMNNKYPWALDISRTRENDLWNYPIENYPITLGYTKYNDWEKNKGIVWWSENTNEDYLYILK